MTEEHRASAIISLCERIYRHAFSDGWRANQSGRTSAPTATAEAWNWYVLDGALEKSFEACSVSEAAPSASPILTSPIKGDSGTLERAEVIQSDRDAAADLYVHQLGDPYLGKNFRSGASDAGAYVQAFARYRVALTPPSPPSRLGELLNIANRSEHLDDAGMFATRQILDALPSLLERISSLEGANRAQGQRIRKLEAALRVARGYVLSNPSERAFRDLVTLDMALGLTTSRETENGVG